MNYKVFLETLEKFLKSIKAISIDMVPYAVTTHKDSGLINDPNDWAEEVDNPRYILELLLSIMSVQTVKIVKELPKVKFD